METDQQPINNNPITDTPGKIKMLFKKKWFLAFLALIILVPILLALFLPPALEKNNGLTPQTRTLPKRPELPTAIPTDTVRMQEAIEEAKKAAEEYDSGQSDLRKEYPWLRTLPLATSKYYVYFDLEKQVFVGKLYPSASSDNVEQMKAVIQKRLELEKGIPIEKFKFEWIVTPQNPN